MLAATLADYDANAGTGAASATEPVRENHQDVPITKPAFLVPYVGNKAVYHAWLQAIDTCNIAEAQVLATTHPALLEIPRQEGTEFDADCEQEANLVLGADTTGMLAAHVALVNLSKHSEDASTCWREMLDVLLEVRISTKFCLATPCINFACFSLENTNCAALVSYLGRIKQYSTSSVIPWRNPSARAPLQSQPPSTQRAQRHGFYAY